MKKLTNDQYLLAKNPETALEKLKSGSIGPLKAVDGFIDYALEVKGWAHKSVLNFVYGIKNCLKVNEVIADWDEIDMPTAAEIGEMDRAPTKQEEILTNSGNIRARRKMRNVEP